MLKRHFFLKKEVNKNSSIVKNIFIFINKGRYIYICFFLFIGTYGIFLDKKIKNRIDGEVWQLPTIVYSRIMHIEPYMSCSKSNMVSLLKAFQYRQVSKILQSGEFVVYDNGIELLRRAFDFPNGEENEIHAFLFFSEKKLLRIYNQDTKKDFGLFRIDPKIISIQYTINKQQRLFIPRAKFPDILIDILLVAEDRDFYKHDGVKVSSIFRAFLTNIVSGHTVQGGSTITQQLVKNLFLTNTRSLWRKFNEIYMALIVDYRYSKDRILELYLNEVYFGQNGNDQVRGFPLASFYYFGRPINELSLDQQAMLIGMIKGASLYNPWKNPKITLDRRNLILKLLRHVNVIDQTLYNILIDRSLGVQNKDSVLVAQPSFMQMVCESVHSINKKEDIYGGKIFTTLDPISQKSAEKSIKLGIQNLRRRYNVTDLEGAIVIIDRFSGEVRAMVGGADPYFFGFNRAMYARRPIGSLIKPVIYLAALNQPDQFHLNTWIADSPVDLKQPDGTIWSPKNYDRQFRGKVTLIEAFIKSLNIPAVNLGLTIGLDTIIDVLMKLGISMDLISSFPSILLGSINLTPLDVAQEFQTIASGGQYSKLSCICNIVDSKNMTLYQYFPKTKRVISPQSVYLILYAMQQVVIKGTSSDLFRKFSSFQLAAKTGTSNDSRDSWFVGIDGKEVVVVWVGRDNNGKTRLTGSSGALKLYSLYLDYYGSPTPLQLLLPNNIVHVPVDYFGNFIEHIIDNKNYEHVLPIWIKNDFKVLLQSSNQLKVVTYTSTSDKLLETQDTREIDAWINNIINN